MIFKLKEINTKEKEKNGEKKVTVARKYITELSDRGIVFNLTIKGLESDMAAYNDETLEAEIQ